MNVLTQGRSEGQSSSKGKTISRGTVVGIILPGASIEKLERLYWNK